METAMKLVVVVIQDVDTPRIMQALLQAGYRVTHVAATGGFMRRGLDTLMIGVEEEKVDDVIDIIRRHVSTETESSLRRGMVFVLPVEHFERL